jgi:hypothetical protein
MASKMTVVAENGKEPAGSQTYDLAAAEGALTLLRVLEWPPDAQAAGTRPRVSVAHARWDGDQRRFQELLEVAIKVLQTLLASTDGHP